MLIQIFMAARGWTLIGLIDSSSTTNKYSNISLHQSIHWMDWGSVVQHHLSSPEDESWWRCSFRYHRLLSCILQLYLKFSISCYGCWVRQRAKVGGVSLCSTAPRSSGLHVCGRFILFHYLSISLSRPCNSVQCYELAICDMRLFHIMCSALSTTYPGISLFLCQEQIRRCHHLISNVKPWNIVCFYLKKHNCESLHVW